MCRLWCADLGVQGPVCCSLFAAFGVPLSVCRAVSVRNLTHKLVFRSDPTDPDHSSELYDLVQDPYELSNKYTDASYALLRAELKEEILRWLVQTSDVTPWSVCDRSSGKCTATPFRRR